MTDVTIDGREVDFYSRLADTWWDRNGPFWPLHTLNGLRCNYIRHQVCGHFKLDAALRRPFRGLRILDVGCGGGILAESMAQLGADVTAIDVVEKNIRIASLHADEQGLDIDYRQQTVADLRRSGERYDALLNMEVVEHVADVPAFMDDCCRLVEPGGCMFVATINRTLQAWLFAIVGAEYVLRWLPRGTHRWEKFVTPEEAGRTLDAGGLDVVDETGVTVNPLTRRMALVPSTAVNYMLFAIRR